MPFYAHSNKFDKSKWQLIKEHLENTAKIANDLGKDAGLSEFAYIVGILHDIGKYSNNFQRKISGSNIKVDHSTAGAKEVKKLFSKSSRQEIIGTLLAYCIAGHHAGLPDFGSGIDMDDERTLSARLKNGISGYSEYSQEIDLSKIILPDFIPIKPIENNINFSLSFFTRMVYSILVDADFIETETFMNNGKKPRGNHDSIDDLCRKNKEFLKRFEKPNSPIDEKRTETLKACLEKAGESPGFYKLTVPTGGGKTFTSMAFALNHAFHNDLKRVIYVIPYTSIIEQNAAQFKKFLGIQNVLEHHSNFEWSEQKQMGIEDYDDETNSVLNKLKLATENWDIPIVVTTNVQFFETLFANRSSRCRKLHNIAKSVIIFDEAQMLPREYLKPSFLAVSELVKNYGCTAILCTATQPDVEQFLPLGTYVTELAPDPKALFQFYKRVKVKSIGKLSDEELSEKINNHRQALCIVNTRKHARGLFENVNECGRFHLSTLMCPIHRRETITQIKSRLKKNLPCRVVSTQIMEAGIDVDFPVGYRAISGIDTLVQAAGRVNREGKKERANLFIFEPDTPFVKRTPAYIKQGAEVAKNVLRKFDDPVCMEAIEEYYSTLYNLQDPSAFDRKRILGCFDKGISGDVNFDFKTAAQEFKLIENNTKPVIIQYDNQVKDILKELRNSIFPTKYSRQLQVYTVNIYEQEFEALQGKGVIDFYHDTYAVLKDENYYSAETGLLIPESESGEAIFFDG